MAKLEATVTIPKHRKYQGLVRLFTPGDDISSWLGNLEFIVNDDAIPEGTARETETWSQSPHKHF